MLRPYQQKAIDEIRSLYGRGTKKVFLHLATGGGKTVVFCEVLKGVAGKGRYAIMVVRGRKLVDQASKRLEREGVDHGVLMAGHWKRRPDAKIQICSIDTLFERKLTPKADLVVIDEAHQATSEGYSWLTEMYPAAYFLPVSATPYCRKSLRHVASTIVRPITIGELIQQKYLVPPVYYAPTNPDLSGVKTNSTGDYNVEALDKLFNQNHPIGDIVFNWNKFGQGRPTILFAVSVKHAEAVALAFNEAGIGAVSVDAGNTDQEREDAVKALNAGEISIICNVGIFCTGVDIPKLSCIIMARPTKSYALYIQQAGRGTRPSENKNNFIIIDHAGNVMRHGCILHERDGSLDPIPKGTNVVDNLTTCEVCYAIFERAFKFCTDCGAENPSCSATVKDEKAMNPLKGQLTEVDEFHLKVIARRGELNDIAKRKSYKKGWVFFKLKDEFGEDVANKYCKKKIVPDFIRQQISRASTSSS